MPALLAQPDVARIGNVAREDGAWRLARVEAETIAALGFLLVSWGWLGCASDTCQPLAVCDIRERDCQLTVANAMACMRGGDSVAPVVDVVSEQEFLARSRVEPSPDQLIEQAAWTRGLSLFGLSAPEVDQDALRMELVSDVAAAYLPEERRIVVIDRGTTMRSEEAVVVLAHEMVHAMQDAEFGFEVLYERSVPTFDGRLALQAMVEGEAVHYELLASVELHGRRAMDLQWGAFYSRWQTEMLTLAEADTQPLDMAYPRFAYAFGGAFASAVWLARGAEGVRALFERPVRATSEIMFGPVQADLAAEQQTLDASGAPVLPASFEFAEQGHLGAWIARIFAARMGVPIAGRWGPARVLGADVLSVYRDPTTDDVFASWRVRLLPGASANAWPLGSPPVEGWVDSTGRDLYLIAQSPAAPIAPRALSWQPIPEQPMPAMDSAMNARMLRAGLRRGCAGRPRVAAPFLEAMLASQ